MTAINSQIKRGSAELAILAVLRDQPLHGYELAREIERQTRGVLVFNVASLYPLLYRLEKRGCLKAHWAISPHGRRRRYYRLTASGKKELAPLRAEWLRLFQALNRVAGVARA